MNFLDQTLVRLATATTRAGLFDQLALEHLVAAGYDAAGMGVTGLYQPSFDEFRMGVSLPSTPRVEGFWQQAGRAEPTELRLTVTGMGGDSISVDGLWRGSIIARVGAVEAPVTAVQGRFADLSLESLDAEIAGSLGSLPAGAQLEQERRSRLLQRFRQGLALPTQITDATVSEWLRAQHADSVGAALERGRGQLGVAGLTVTMAAAPPLPALPRPLPVTVALLIRDHGVSLAELLQVSHRVRERLGALGVERPRGGAGQRHGILVGWMLPAPFLDDADWPGTDRAARRTAASAWLGAEGIALVPVT